MDRGIAIAELESLMPLGTTKTRFQRAERDGFGRVPTASALSCSPNAHTFGARLINLHGNKRHENRKSFLKTVK